MNGRGPSFVGAAALGVVGLIGCDLMSSAPAPEVPRTAAGLWSISLPSTEGWRPMAYACRAADTQLLVADSDFVNEHRQCDPARDRLDGEAFVRRLSCREDGRTVAVSQTLSGDMATDFTHRMESGAEPAVTFRYRRLGDCPADWRPGDVAQNGQWGRPEWALRNRVTGEERRAAALPDMMRQAN